MTSIKQWSSHLFPIHRNEYIKFFLLASICFLVCTNYTLLRNVKETLVITNPKMGLQMVPFLRTWMLMPFMLFFVKMYAFLSARHNQAQVCYSLLSIFLIFFLLFTFILYPYQEFFQLNQLGDWISSWPIPLSEQLASMFRYWIFSIYYCLSEVWGTLVILILFWGISNRSNTVDEARRFYSPILLITNVSGLFASQISLFFSKSPLKKILFPNQHIWGSTLLSITLCVCLFTIVIFILFYVFFQKFTKNPTESSLKEKAASKEEMTLTNILRTMIYDKMFLLLSIVVFSYFFTSAMMEMIWKYSLQQLYPNSNDFNDYLNRCTMYVSLISAFLALSVTGNLIQKFSWKVNALITPILLSIPLILIIYSLFYPIELHYQVFFGALYYCLNRICKFTFFDLTKEVAIVEFSPLKQIKIKTAMDGLVPKLAKTSESILLQVFLILFHSFALMIPAVMAIVLVVHVLWIYSSAEIKIKTFSPVRT